MELAKELGIQDSVSFTGHTFRRTGATWLANNGVSITLIKQAGRWLSEKVANGKLI